MTELINFDTFQDAFAYFREAGRPVVVWINEECWKLYPSGLAKKADP